MGWPHPSALYASANQAAAAEPGSESAFAVPADASAPADAPAARAQLASGAKGVLRPNLSSTSLHSQAHSDTPSRKARGTRGSGKGGAGSNGNRGAEKGRVIPSGL